MIVYNKTAPLDQMICQAVGGYQFTDNSASDWDGYVIPDGTFQGNVNISLHETAQKTGVVDFLVKKDGVLTGYDTGYYAIFTAMYRVGMSLKDKKVLVLGEDTLAISGAILAKELGAKEVVKLAPDAKGIFDTQAHHDTQIILRTAPVSDDILPVEDFAVFPYLEGIVDCNPLPLGTRLIREGEAWDKITMGGLYVHVAMHLIRLGYLLGESVSPTRIGEVFRKLSYDLSNLVLVGLEGSGHRQVAKVLGEMTGREVVSVSPLRESVMRACELTGKILVLHESVCEEVTYSHLFSRGGRVYFFIRPLETIEENPLHGEALAARYKTLLPGFRAFSEETVTFAKDPVVPAKEILANFTSLPYKKHE